MINLGEETEAKIAECGYQTYFVDYVCDDTTWYTWDEFIEAAAQIDYDDGYGSQEINHGLKIVFKDGSWLERHEYDGAEWWRYKELPRKDGRDRGKVALQEDLLW